MIPYIQLANLRVFGLEFEPFDILLGLALLVGYFLARRRAAQCGLDPTTTGEGIFAMMIGGVLGAHFVSVVFYFPERIAGDPWTLLRFWEGLSSFGAILGGLLGGFVFFRLRKVAFLPSLDALLFGAVPGWAIGRFGCAVVHDHPGQPSSFVLAVRFPAESACYATDTSKVWSGCHDLGLYEVLLLLLLTGVLYGLRNCRPFAGFHPGLFLVLYAPARFFFDSLRLIDRRYLGMTPGQYFSIVLFVIGTALLVTGRRRMLES